MLIIGILATVLLAMFGILYSLLGYNLGFRNHFIERITKEATDAGMKNESLLKGRRMYIEREDLRPVRVNLYQPQSGEILPVIFAAHGGNFIDHDADDIDSFCDRLSKKLNVNIVSISYTKIKPHVTTYPQEEIRDTIMYFRRHGREYNMDTKRFLVMGFEAGAYLMLNAETAVIQKGAVPYGTIMFDPFLDYVAVSLAQAGRHPGPVALVLSGRENDEADRYEFELRQAGIEVRTRRIPDMDPGVLLSGEAADETERLSLENFRKWMEETVNLFLYR